jgi:hypothetical protein
VKRAPQVSHPLGYTVIMNRKNQPARTLPAPLRRSSAHGASPVTSAPPRPSADSKPEVGGLLGLCHEIAGLLLRRYAENSDAVAVRREAKAMLMKMMACDAVRADHLLDLALELIHVKAKGRYQRNALELSLLIARAGDQVRNVSDN